MGELIQIDASGTHVLDPVGVASVGVAFAPSGEVLEVVGTDGSLTQFDSTGSHVLATAGVSAAAVAFGASGEVLELVGTDGSLTQFDASGSHILASAGVASVGVAFDASGEVLEVVGTDGSLTQHDSSGAQVLATAGVIAASVAFGPSGEVLDEVIACYCRGTLIRTDRGEVPIEELTIGDRILTVSGALRPIKWIGRRGYDGRFIAGNRQVLPVVVKTGALADGVPARDLWLSPGHALYLDGVVVPVAHLVNSMSIRQAIEVEAVEYFHIELDSHDILLAERAPAESYVDVGNRAQFQNAAEFPRLYPEDQRPGAYCAPLCEGGETVAAIRRRLLARLPALGWQMIEDCDLHLVVDGRRLDRERAEGEVWVFGVPAGARDIRIASRAAAPRVIGINDDPRRLGIMLRRMVLRSASLTITVGFDAPSLTEGFDAPEATHRWTDGYARVPGSLLHCFDGDFELELDAGPMPFYPVRAGAEQCAVIAPPPQLAAAGRQAAVGPVLAGGVRAPESAHDPAARC